VPTLAWVHCAVLGPPSDHRRAAAPPSTNRARILLGLALAGLAGPAVLAFFSGGYFDGPRALAGIVAWALVLAGLVLAPGALPRGRMALLAVGGLAAFALWTLLSTAWAPIPGHAYPYGQLGVLYLGAVLAGAMLLRGRSAQRAVEPMLILGALVVIGYGLSARLLPGVVHIGDSAIAEGRLDEPLTYWNATGELAAIGLVLAIRVAGAGDRPVPLRALAAAACAPLGLGLYLSFSRGALFAAVAGLLTLIVIAPHREQAQAIVAGVLAAVVSTAVAAPMAGLTKLTGHLSTRESQGAIAFAVLVAVMLLAAGAIVWMARRGRPGRLPLPPRAPVIVLGLICAGLALAIVLGAKESTRVPTGAARYTSLSSDRYDYWRVALDTFVAHPVAGIGAGGWQVKWLQLRHSASYAVDAHSLPLQTLAELGLVGVAFLLTWLAGLIGAARAALRTAVGTAAGPVAALVVYLVHAPLDWDWELPALTLVAAVLAGLVVAVASEAARDAGPPADVRQADGRRAQAGDIVAVP
jgi:O-antigen ligase